MSSWKFLRIVFALFDGCIGELENYQSNDANYPHCEEQYAIIKVDYHIVNRFSCRNAFTWKRSHLSRVYINLFREWLQRYEISACEQWVQRISGCGATVPAWCSRHNAVNFVSTIGNCGRDECSSSDVWIFNSTGIQGVFILLVWGIRPANLRAPHRSNIRSCLISPFVRWEKALRIMYLSWCWVEEEGMLWRLYTQQYFLLEAS